MMKIATALTKYTGTANHKNQHSAEHHKNLASFGANSNMSDSDMEKIFKEWATRNHPDKGGDHEKFINAHAAYMNSKEKRVTNPKYIHEAGPKIRRAAQELYR